MLGRLDAIGLAMLLLAAAVAIAQGSALLAVGISTVLGIAGSIFVVKPFFRTEELSLIVQRVARLRTGNAAAERLLADAEASPPLRLDGLALADRLWMLRGTALLIASLLLNFLGFILDRAS